MLSFQRTRVLLVGAAAKIHGKDERKGLGKYNGAKEMQKEESIYKKKEEKSSHIVLVNAADRLCTQPKGSRRHASSFLSEVSESWH